MSTTGNMPGIPVSGVWVVHVYFGEEEVTGSPLHVRVHDPHKAWLAGPDRAFTGDLLIYKGRNCVWFHKNIVRFLY